MNCSGDRIDFTGTALKPSVSSFEQKKNKQFNTYLEGKCHTTMLHTQLNRKCCSVSYISLPELDGLIIPFAGLFGHFVCGKKTCSLAIGTFTCYYLLQCISLSPFPLTSCCDTHTHTHTRTLCIKYDA